MRDWADEEAAEIMRLLYRLGHDSLPIIAIRLRDIQVRGEIIGMQEAEQISSRLLTAAGMVS